MAMSQNGTTRTTDENRAPTTIPTPLFVPMMPMFFPFGNPNTTGQQYFAPAVYPNVSPYSSTTDHRHGNYGLGYNTFYGPFYPTTNNILSPTTHVSNSPALIAPRPLLPPPLLPTHSLAGSSIFANDIERNKNLNIRECSSPKKEKQPLQIVDVNDNHTDTRKRKDSSSSSSLASHPESCHMPLSSSAQENDSDNPQDDFLTFIEQKTKATMPELNPFATEFSFVNDKTLTKDSSPMTTNGTDNPSSYRLLIDNLIEKSLESIEAIKKSTKKVSVNDISVQCNQINDCINRSTQTIDHTNNSDLIEEYTLRTMKLMDKLLDNFRSIYQNDLYNECNTMAHTCDELRHLVLFIHHVITSSDNKQRKKALIDLDNPFANMIQDLANDTNRYRTVSQIPHAAGRGARRLMPSTSNSPVPSFSCRQVDSVTRVRSKLCILCQRPMEDSEDVMHKLCRSLSSRPNTSTNT